MKNTSKVATIEPIVVTDSAMSIAVRGVFVSGWTSIKMPDGTQNHAVFFV
jgi:hypothetical protein